MKARSLAVVISIGIMVVAFVTIAAKPSEEAGKTKAIPIKNLNGDHGDYDLYCWDNAVRILIKTGDPIKFLKAQADAIKQVESTGKKVTKVESGTTIILWLDKAK